MIDEQLVLGSDLGPGQRSAIDSHLVQSSIEPIVFVLVVVGSDFEERLGRILDWPGLLSRTGHRLAVDVERHGGAIVGAGQVVPLPELVVGVGLEVGQAVGSAIGGHGQAEATSVEAQDEASFVGTIVLDRTDNSAPGGLLVNSDPGGGRQCCRGHPGRGVFRLDHSDSHPAASIECQDLVHTVLGNPKASFECGGRAVGEVVDLAAIQVRCLEDEAGHECGIADGGDLGERNARGKLSGQWLGAAGWLFGCGDRVHYKGGDDSGVGTDQQRAIGNRQSKDSA